EYVIDLTGILNNGVKEGEFHLLFTGNNHYIALVPEADGIADELPPPPKASNVVIDARVSTAKLDLKLSTTSKLSQGINTSSKSAEAMVEIHHINVGQGDSTLIQ